MSGIIATCLRSTFWDFSRGYCFIAIGPSECCYRITETCAGSGCCNLCSCGMICCPCVLCLGASSLIIKLYSIILLPALIPIKWSVKATITGINYGGKKIKENSLIYVLTRGKTDINLDKYFRDHSNWNGLENKNLYLKKERASSCIMALSYRHLGDSMEKTYLTKGSIDFINRYEEHVEGLWVDCLCISPSGQSLAQAFGYMRHIYKNAKVYPWWSYQEESESFIDRGWIYQEVMCRNLMIDRVSTDMMEAVVKKRSSGDCTLNIIIRHLNTCDIERESDIFAATFIMVEDDLINNLTSRTETFNLCQKGYSRVRPLLPDNKTLKLMGWQKVYMKMQNGYTEYKWNGNTLQLTSRTENCIQTLSSLVKSHDIVVDSVKIGRGIFFTNSISCACFRTCC
jgi:hypothetical protein